MNFTRLLTGSRFFKVT